MSNGIATAEVGLLPFTGLLPDDLPRDPLPVLGAWLDDARRAGATPNPDSMTLATADEHGRPSARVVLCKGLNPSAGYLLFFTNYQSRKGDQLAKNSHAAAVFHWDAAGRQARVEGRVVRSPAAESDAYFASRPLMSRVGAWASEQSRSLADRADFMGRVLREAARFHVSVEEMIADTPGVEVPRPEHWGGYRLWIERAELWVGAMGRWHDRAMWERTLPASLEDGGAGRGPWSVTRLYP